ncbi:hypothetical protein [Aquabacter sp. CN5-332]|uniref:hypothetical protein n=1 Tax=Aquabacter sp. CN5-332 TaxID=3156608 RepID=UPI0032B486EA
MARALKLALAGVLLFAGVVAATAQESHGQGSTSRMIIVSPRAEMRIGNQEAVLTYDGRRLVLFLQRYSDGLPTGGAKIELTAGSVAAPLEELAPGTYASNDVSLATGQNDIKLAYTIGDRKGVATVPLVLPQRGVEGSALGAMRAPSTAGINGLMLAVIAVIIFLAVNVLLALRARTARPGAPA